jgi:hypothetical protein
MKGKHIQPPGDQVLLKAIYREVHDRADFRNSIPCNLTLEEIHLLRYACGNTVCNIILCKEPVALYGMFYCVWCDMFIAGI